VAGLAFGYAATLTGSLWTPIVAHFVINAQGLLEVRRRTARRGAAAAPTAPVPEVPAAPVAEPLKESEIEPGASEDAPAG